MAAAGSSLPPDQSAPPQDGSFPTDKAMAPSDGSAPSNKHVATTGISAPPDEQIAASGSPLPPDKSMAARGGSLPPDKPTAAAGEGSLPPEKPTAAAGEGSLPPDKPTAVADTLPRIKPAAAEGGSVPPSKSTAEGGGSQLPAPVISKFDESMTNYFICRDCKTHFSPMQELIRRYFENNKHYALFRNMMNVVLEPKYRLANSKTMVSPTYCIKCRADLGFKMIYLKEETADVKAGMFLLYTNKLLLWRDNEEIDPEQEEQILRARISELQERRQKLEDLLEHKQKVEHLLKALEKK